MTKSRRKKQKAVARKDVAVCWYRLNVYANGAAHREVHVLPAVAPYVIAELRKTADELEARGITKPPAPEDAA